MMRIGIVAFAITLAGVFPIRAQSVPAFRAETGSFAEAYSVSGRQGRRPDNTLRFYATPSISWLGMSISANLLWSTENQFVAQSINRYYLNPRWSWGQLHAGDYVPVMSQYTANSVRIRGGGVELSPGVFRAAFAAGRSQEASDLSPFDAAPARTLYTGLVGVGTPGRTFITISAMRAVDDTAGVDSLSVPPAENLVGAVSAGVSLAGGLLRLSGEGAASLFSRDLRASTLDGLEQPEWTESLFKPRISSRLDHAWNAKARLALRSFSIGAQYEYVGPGFTTMGNPYMANDSREVQIVTTLRALRGRFNTNVSVGERRDNLADDKRGTTRRRTATAVVTVVGGRWTNSTVNVLVNGLTRDPTPLDPTAPTPAVLDTFRLKNIALSVGVTQQFRFDLGLPQTVTLQYSEQRVDDSSPRYDGQLDATSRSAAIEYGLSLTDQLNVSVKPGYQEFFSAARDERFWSLGVDLARLSRDSKWSARLRTTYSDLRQGMQLRQTAQVSYRLTSRDNLSAQLRHSRLSGTERDFTETIATFRVSRRW